MLRDKHRFILAIRNMGDGTIEKIRYTLDGVIITRVLDRVSGGFLIRETGAKTLIIKDDKILSINSNIKLKPLAKLGTKDLELTFVENDNIGVIDLECYKDQDGIDKVYALGFKTKLDKDVTTYYIDSSDLDSDKIVLEMINTLLRTKYSNITFYCHNLGGYDSIFILGVILRYNDQLNKYKEDLKEFTYG